MIQLPKWEKTSRQSELHAETAFVESEKTPLIHHDVTDSYSKYKQEIEKYYLIFPGLFGQLLLPFSVYTNGAKIFNTHQPEGSLTAINGIRFISMTWVILGHAYGFILSDVDNVGSFLPKMIKRATFPAISNALVSVDTFFVLSGTLLVYIVMKELKKKGGKLNWGMFYFHRFWRLTPPYMLVLMVYVSLFPYIGSGPVWKKDGAEYNYCKNSWYYNLLYINNFFEKPEDTCFGWAWYLANDMQFFVLSPLIILPLFLGDMTHYYEIYFRPYFRMGPYLVGMFTGYLLYKTDLKFKMNRFLNLFGWLIAAVSACAVLYGVYDDVNGSRESREVSSFYITVHRTVWGAAVGWVIFACAHGYGGYVNTVLSWKGFIPLSRLTYCAYLVHPPVIYYYLSTRRRLIHLSDIEIIYEFLGHLGLSYAAAFLASLAFEAPMMGLEKVIFKSKEHKK
ncbi:nose resistant to fluoxetine protein 6-like [Mytilus californianus]|uniref:nose resistant to fluoxetine protein 6-like n=1 Tax=Mytilus californianus TaxID=6549 RepID=UPI0022455EDA|nr:nose resistant to fluoxetine protein 6-like [Mytilus californianus]